jgi:hypothetical protein
MADDHRSLTTVWNRVSVSAPASQHTSGPIRRFPYRNVTVPAVGLSYVASKWFRYYLVDFIQNRMSEIESKEGVIQLTNQSQTPVPCDSADAPTNYDRGTPHVYGNMTNPRSGRSSAVDMSLCELPVDIGRMTLGWVNQEQTGVLEDLSKRDRHLLYCVFVREMDWESTAHTFGVSAREAKRWYTAVICRAASEDRPGACQTRAGGL